MELEERRSTGGCLIMAAISAVFTLARAAEILGEDQDLLWQLSDTMEPEDGVLWINDIGEQQTLALTMQGIDNLRELISDQNSRSL